MAAIRIKLGDENRIFIESNVLKSPLFAEQYAQLIKKITEYVRAEKEDGESNSNNFNNLFLINGERGAGKSSMLTSMHGYLKKKDAIDDKKFLRLKVVDPSSFTNNANILQIIIAELFKEFKKDTQERQISYEEKNEITKIFVQIKHALCVLDSPTISAADDSDIESLVDLSNAIVLEELIDKLICKILKARDEDMLLVCVDDIDLNTAHAYEMLEQIRKYLILPNVIVLIAAKMSQLQDVVLQHYLYEYSSLVSNDIMNTQDVLEMSNKYLLKLLPLEHRINLNSAIDKFLQPIDIYDGEKLILSANNGSELIYKLIYLKTGIHYMSVQSEINYIVPRNLRAFRFLVKILSDMDPQKSNANIDKYQQYFLTEWAPQNLCRNEQQEIEEILHISDLSKINKQIIRFITDKINLKEYPQQISTLVDINNVYSNVSLGDVMAMIIWSKSINSSEQFARYIYAIKHAYTILLEKAYREMLQEKSLTMEIETYNDSNKEEYLNSYQRLVGGSLLNAYTWSYLLPMSNKGENRLHRSILTTGYTINQLPPIILYSILTPQRTKSVNEGEAYRKQMPIYYQLPLEKSNEFIIDWFNVLYSIPFSIEQFARFQDDEMRKSLLDSLREEQVEDPEIFRTFHELAIRSVDLLECIYWHIRAKRNYLRSGGDEINIYKRLFNTIKEVELCEYFSEKDKRCYSVLFELAINHLDKDKEITIHLLSEDESQVPKRAIGFPELSTISKITTVEQLKARMRLINGWKGYKAEWIDREIDKLNFTDEDMQNLEPLVIRNRLKQVGK